MFGLFGKKSKKDNEENENIYDPEKVTVFYWETSQYSNINLNRQGIFPFEKASWS